MGDLVCKIEISKHNGITIDIDDGSGDMQQTIHLDGAEITTTCKKGDDISTIVQNPTSIHIDTKEFILNTESIICTSTKSTLMKSGGTMEVESQKDMMLTSPQKIDLESKDVIASATNNMTVVGENEVLLKHERTSGEDKDDRAANDLEVKFDGEKRPDKTGKGSKKQELSIKNTKVDLKESTDVSVDSKTIGLTAASGAEIDGGTKVDIKGSTGVTIDGGTKLSCTGTMAEIKGTTVKLG